jgi:hypothetical protein
MCHPMDSLWCQCDYGRLFSEKSSVSAVGQAGFDNSLLFGIAIGGSKRAGSWMSRFDPDSDFDFDKCNGNMGYYLTS